MFLQPSGDEPGVHHPLVSAELHRTIVADGLAVKSQEHVVCLQGLRLGV